MREAEILAEQLMDDFPTAIREKQFIVYFQPKYDIRESEPVLTGAEGVETNEQFVSLKKMDCDIIQGYYFSRPLAPDDFEKLLVHCQRRNSVC